MSKASTKPRPSVIIKLTYPIQWDEEGEVTEIELKRPKGKHIKQLGKDVSMKEIFEIASKISGYTPAFFDEMDVSDCFKVSDAVAGFLDGGPKTGKTV